MSIDDEVHRATRLLETVIQAAGATRKELDLKLGAGPGYVSQVLTGRMELKLRHVLSILRALGVEPSLYFSTLYPENRQPSDSVVMEEFLRRFEKLGLGTKAATPSALPGVPVDPQALHELIHEAVRSALAEQQGKPTR